MDQIQTQDRLDPEVAQEVITVLSKKIANLRAENAQLQVWPSLMRRNRPDAVRSDLNPTESTEWGIREDRRHRP